jgi:O-antigen ligase
MQDMKVSYTDKGKMLVLGRRFERASFFFVLGSVIFAISAEVLIIPMASRLPDWLVYLVAGFLLTIPLWATRGEFLAITLLFAALAYPYRLQIAVGPFNSFSIAEIALALAGSVVVLRRFGNSAKTRRLATSARTKTRIQRLDVLILAYLGINALSVLWAAEPSLAIRGLVPILEFVAFYYLIVFFCSTWPKTERIVALYLALGIAAIVLAAVYYFGRLSFLEIQSAAGNEDLLRQDLTRLGSPAWGRSNYFASMLLLFLPAYWSIAILSASKKRQLAFGAISILGLIVFLFTLSRGGFVSLAVAFLAWLTLLLASKRGGLRTLTLLLIGAVVLGLGMRIAFVHFPDIHLVMNDISSRVLVTDDVNTTSRFYLAQTALGIIRDNPFGIGVGNTDAMPQFIGLHLHNIYLQELLEMGWVGGIVFILMLFALLKRNWLLVKVAKNTPYEALAFGLVAGYLGILVNVLGEASFEGAMFGWLFWTVQGMVRGLERQLRQPINESSP